jgi:hypothetical protein
LRRGAGEPWTARLKAKSPENNVEAPCTEHHVQLWLDMVLNVHSINFSITGKIAIVLAGEVKSALAKQSR